jgi:hypothetical protein
VSLMTHQRQVKGIGTKNADERQAKGIHDRVCHERHLSGRSQREDQGVL